MFKEGKLELQDYLSKYAANLNVEIIELLEGEEEAELDQEDLEIWKMSAEVEEDQQHDNNWEPQIPATSPETTIPSTTISPSIPSPPVEATTSKALLLIESKKRKQQDVSSSDSSFENKPQIKKTVRQKRQPLPKSNTTLSSDEELQHNEDEVVICPKNGVMLSDNQIVAAIRMLRAQFVDIGGLVDTVRFQKDISETFDLNLKEKSVFIIHCNGNHWVNFQSFLIIIFFSRF